MKLVRLWRNRRDWKLEVGRFKRLRIKCFIIAMVFTLVGLGVISILFRLSTTSDAERFRTSSIFSGEELFAIQSMKWKNDELRIIYYHCIPQGQSGIFYIKRPWVVLCSNFRDNLEAAPAHKISVDHSYDIRFLNGKTTEESIEIVVIPPADAKYVAIQCGRIETIPILIADKPDPIVSVLDWLRVLFK